MNKEIRIGKIDKKKLKAMELARVDRSNRLTSLNTKTTTSYIGTPKKPGKDRCFDHCSSCETIGRLRKNALSNFGNLNFFKMWS